MADFNPLARQYELVIEPADLTLAQRAEAAEEEKAGAYARSQRAHQALEDAEERIERLEQAVREARDTFRKFALWRPIAGEAQEERQVQLGLAADRLDALDAPAGGTG